MFRTGFVGRQFPSGAGAGLAGGYSPAISFDFTGGTTDARLTTVRAGNTATYFDNTGTLQTALANTQRYDYDPASLQINGLLIEEARINLNTFSQAINSWVGKTDTVVTDNNSVSPDGTTNASLCTEGTAGTAANLSPAATVADGATITGSAFFKRGNNDWIRFIVADPTLNNGAAAWINTSTGALGTVGARGTGTSPVGSVQTIRNGWYRLILKCTLPAGTTTCCVAITSASADNSATRVNNATYRLWGVQLEQSGFATSYIPTSGSAVTRNADVVTATGLSLPTARGASLYVDAIAKQNTVAGTNCDWAIADDGSANNNIVLVTPASQSTVRYIVTVGGVAIDNAGDITTGVRPTPFKAAHSFSAATALPAMNGVLGGALAGGQLPTLTRIQFGNGGITQINGWLRAVRFWSRALDGGELVQLTGQPTLDLGFIDPTGGIDSRITFTRASIATYIDSSCTMRQVSSNVARFDHDVVTGTPLGLLIEENRVQLLTNSQTGWSASNSVVSTDLVPLFSGANILKITWPSAVANGPNFVNISVSSSFSYALSCYMWIPSSYNGALDGRPQLDIDIGTLGSGGTAVTGIADLSKRDQWQRVTSIANLGTGASATLNFVIRRNYIPGLAGQSFYVTCPQVELGQFSTSYIPSTSGAVSRLIENVTMPVGPWYSSAASTIAVEIMMPVVGTVNNWQMAARLDDTTQNNRIQLFRTIASLNYNVQVTAAAADQINVSIGTVVPGAVIKAAVAATAGAQRSTTNGATPVTASGASQPSGISVMRIGCDHVGSLLLNGYMRRLRVWPRALSSAELQQVTT